MNNPRDTKINRDKGECYQSLFTAIQDAGGMITEDVLDISVFEFIDTIAGQNGIRFCFVKPEDAPIHPKGAKHE